MATLESLFKTVELQSEILSLVIKVLKDVGTKEDLSHSGNLLLSLSKCANFDMTLMFIDSKEKKQVNEIIGEIKAANAVDKQVIS